MMQNNKKTTENKLIRMKIGPTNIFLIEYNNGYLMVDTGYANKYNDFLEKLKKLRISVLDIKLLFLTHFHSDHVGFAGKIIEESEARVIVHKNSIPFLEKGGHENTRLSFGRNLLVEGLFYFYIKLNKVSNHYPPLKISEKYMIIEGDDDKILREFGINARILYTPGHTHGCISLLLDNGKAIVGDLIMNTLNIPKKNFDPLVAEDYNLLHKSWQKILDAHAEIIYPSHGKETSSRELLKQLKKRLKDLKKH